MVTLIVVSQLGAKLVSTDRGQALEVSVVVVLVSLVVLFRSIRWLMSRTLEVVKVMRIRSIHIASCISKRQGDEEACNEKAQVCRC